MRSKRLDQQVVDVGDLIAAAAGRRTAKDLLLGPAEHLAGLDRLARRRRGGFRCWRGSAPAAWPCRGRSRRSRRRWRRTGTALGHLGQVGRAADRLEIARLLRSRSSKQRGVDPPALVVHRQQVGEELLVGVGVEVVRPQDQRHVVAQVGIQQQAAQDASFRRRGSAAAAGRGFRKKAAWPRVARQSVESWPYVATLRDALPSGFDCRAVIIAANSRSQPGAARTADIGKAQGRPPTRGPLGNGMPAFPGLVA